MISSLLPWDWGFFLPPMTSLFLKRNKFRIFLLVPLLLMSALLRLQWPMSTSRLLKFVRCTVLCHLVGGLVYLAITSLDVFYLVQIHSQSISAPSLVHYSHLSHSATSSSFLPTPKFITTSGLFRCYLASDPLNHRSFFAYCVLLCGYVIVWKTTKEIAVSCLSERMSCELWLSSHQSGMTTVVA